MEGKYIKEILNERGVNISFVARKIGANRSQLSRFLNGSNKGSHITKEHLNNLHIFMEKYLGIKN